MLRSILMSAVALPLVLTVATAARANAPLGYRLRAHTHFTIRSTMTLHPPGLGTRLATLAVDTRVLGTSGGKMRLRQHVVAEVTGQRSRQATYETELSPAGRFAGVTGVDMSDPEMVVLVRGAEQMFPLLPVKPVAVGESWTERREFPMLPVRGLDLPDQLEVDLAYRLLERASPPRATDVLALSASASPGQRADLRYQGTATVDSRSGQLLASQFKGSLKVRVRKGFVKVMVKIPFDTEVTVDASGPDVRAAALVTPGTRTIALLGVR